MQSRRREYNLSQEQLKEKHDIDLAVTALKRALEHIAWSEYDRTMLHPIHPEEEASYAIKSWPQLFVPYTKDYDWLGITTYNLNVILGKLALFQKKENVVAIDSISTQEWNEIFGESCELAEGPMRDMCFDSQFAPKFASVYGIPHTLCFVESTFGTYHISVTNPVLLEVFQDVVHNNPYDSDMFIDICDRIVAAHNESTDSLLEKYCKSDYKLVALRTYTELAHVRDGDTLDFGRPLPRYWFDPLDFESANSESLLRDYLALPEETHPKLTHVIVCGFPAGALFLCCRAESQREGGGGGIEYLYLRNVSQRVQVVRTIQLI